MKGIVNMGNTCFMNSVIQCLYNTKVLTNFILTGKYREDVNLDAKEETEMMVQYCRVVSALHDDDDDEFHSIEPESFKKRLEKIYQQYEGWHQHDSHELLMALLDILHISLKYTVGIRSPGEGASREDIAYVKRCKELYEKDYSFIVKCFHGQYLSRVKCPNCEAVYRNYDPFTIVEVPIENETVLENALEKFLDIETLDTDNQWLCSSCEQRGNALKKIDFWVLPTTLVITLKRFNVYHHQQTRGYKLTHNVDYPPYLRIRESSTKNVINYKLYAVNCHTGGLDGGHYYSVCQSVKDGYWYKLNDESAYKVSSETDIFTNNAYILFYEKVL